jgi:hypothetical protein
MYFILINLVECSIITQAGENVVVSKCGTDALFVRVIVYSLMDNFSAIWLLSPEIPAPISHNGIQTRDVKVIRPLRCHSNQCATRAKYKTNL